jgi:hypothetical protein
VRIDGAIVDVIQASKPEPRIMRCEFSEHERTTIKPMLPNKPRGVQFGKLPKDLGGSQTHPAFFAALPRAAGGTGSDRCFPAHSAIMSLASESSGNSLWMSR